MTGKEHQILDSVLNLWRSAVNVHDYDRAASYFTDDVIFQGLHPYSVGPKGVAEYYASQPIGMTAGYTIRETRHLADDLVLGYLSVDFAFTDRPVLTVSLSVIVRRTGNGWLISHYQVSQLAQLDATTPVMDRAAGGD
jgi:ketosteroid isomerase-like protein